MVDFVPDHNGIYHCLAQNLQDGLQNYLLETEGEPEIQDQRMRVPENAESARESSEAAAEDVLQRTAFCGDGVCNSGENCSTCAQDCKQVSTLLIHFCSHSLL